MSVSPLPFRMPHRTQEMQEAQETQEAQDRQETQGTHRVSSRRVGESSVSCVKQAREGEPCASSSSCGSCVNGSRVEESELQRFLRKAAGRSADEVAKHQRSAGPYRSPALMFARCLKARPEFATLDAETATARVDAEIAPMFPPDHPAPWVALGLSDLDSREHGSDPRTDFLTVWDSVTTPFHLGSRVQEAANQADEKPLDLGGRFTCAGDAKFVRLLSICYWLGQLGGGVFYVSCRDAGEVLEVSPTTVSQLLRRAEKTGFIEAVRPYTERDRVCRRAKEWRFKPGYEARFLE